MKKKDKELMLSDYDRLSREYHALRKICELLVRTEEGCGGNACNIGGGLCCNCGQYRLKLMTRIRELLGMTP